MAGAALFSVRLPASSRRGIARTYSVAAEGAAGAPRPVAVLFPPQPALGGDGENNVVRGVERALVRGGLAALRFDYRASGRSPDPPEVANRFEFWRRVEEEGLVEPSIEDGLRAVRTALRLGPLAGLVGYSFGAVAAALVRERLGSDAPLVAIAPPVARYEARSAFDRAATLVVFGERDVLEPPPPPSETERHVGRRCVVERRARSDHFFRGEEEELGVRAVRWLQETGR